jgi:transposase
MASRSLVRLTDAQWEAIRPHLPVVPNGPRGGRPRADDRSCFEGILWVLRSGARWKDLPSEYPSPSTCWRRLVDWETSGILLTIWQALLDTLGEQQLLDWEEVFIDGTFAPAKKGATASERPNAERVQSLWWWSMAREFHSHAGPRLLALLRSRWRKESLRKSPRATRPRRSSPTKPTTAGRCARGLGKKAGT